MLDNIHIIKTGGVDTIFQIRHANDFIENNVVGIGFYLVGDISEMTEGELLKKVYKIYKDEGPRIKGYLLRLRDKIKIGDPFITYMSPNTIVAVGRIKGKYFFDKRYNMDSKEGLGLPHRRKVEWIKEPQFFSRYELPDYVSKRVALPPTFITIKYDFNKLIEYLKDNLK